MSRLMRIVARANLALLRDRSGATAIEYGLLATGISVAIIAVVFTLGDTLGALFTDVAEIIAPTP